MVTSNDEWVRERAILLALEIAACSSTTLREDMLIAFGQAAIERGKETGAVEWGLAYEDGRQSILARLENPDEAMVEAVHPWVINAYGINWHEQAKTLIRTLARTLTEGQENSDG